MKKPCILASTFLALGISLQGPAAVVADCTSGLQSFTIAETQISCDGNLGGNPPIIPTDFPVLRFMTSLSITGGEQNPLLGRIPHQLVNATSLTSLVLDGANLGGSIPVELGQLSGLKTLKLKGSLEFQIPSELGQLEQLQVLEIAGTRLTGTIPSELGKLTLLTSLKLNGKELRGTIPSELASLPNLESLDLSGNKLEGSLDSIVREDQYAEINLSNNKLTGTIPDGLLATSIQLGSNNLSGEIPRALVGLETLRKIDVSSNKLQGSVPAVPAATTYFDLSNNEFTGQLPNNFVVQQGDMMETLNLANNQLTGALPTFGRSFGSFGTLSFANNKFTGTLNNFAVRFSDTQIEPIVVSLHNNQFEGVLPSWLGEAGVRYATVLPNNFVGALPASGKLRHCANPECSVFLTLEQELPPVSGQGEECYLDADTSFGFSRCVVKDTVQLKCIGVCVAESVSADCKSPNEDGSACNQTAFVGNVSELWVSQEDFAFDGTQLVSLPTLFGSIVITFLGAVTILVCYMQTKGRINKMKLA